MAATSLSLTKAFLGLYILWRHYKYMLKLKSDIWISNFELFKVSYVYLKFMVKICRNWPNGISDFETDIFSKSIGNRVNLIWHELTKPKALPMKPFQRSIKTENFSAIQNPATGFGSIRISEAVQLGRSEPKRKSQDWSGNSKSPWWCIFSNGLFPLFRVFHSKFEDKIVLWSFRCFFGKVEFWGRSGFWEN